MEAGTVTGGGVCNPGGYESTAPVPVPPFALLGGCGEAAIPDDFSLRRFGRVRHRLERRQVKSDQSH